MADRPISILTANGKIRKGESAPKLSRSALLRIYRTMLLSRRVDEQMTRLQRQGRISFYIGSVGEEAAIIGSVAALTDTDWVVPCYREAGAAFFRGYTLYDYFCQLFGNADDKMHGRQMPNHWSIKNLYFTSVSSPVGTQISHAAGMAMGAKLTRATDVAMVYFGDGATSQGDFHVGCNFAGVYQAPVVFFCRNNKWAISVPFEQQTAAESIAVKAKAYGFRGIQVDGNDVLAVYEVTRKAAEAARKGTGPTLIEALTYRQGGHSTSDDPRAYRDDAEVAEWKKKDPLLRFQKFLIDQGLWGKDDDEALEEEIKQEIQSNRKKAEQVGPPELATLFEDVYAEIPWHLEEQKKLLEGLGPPPATH